jgi:hypothetical protein
VREESWALIFPPLEGRGRKLRERKEGRAGNSATERRKHTLSLSVVVASLSS